MSNAPNRTALSGGNCIKRKIVDYGQSVRARLLMLANQRGIQLEYVLLRYALERFLYRLGISA